MPTDSCHVKFPCTSDSVIRPQEASLAQKALSVTRGLAVLSTRGFGTRQLLPGGAPRSLTIGPKMIAHTYFGNQFPIIWVGFWQNGFFRGFLFLSRQILSQILSPDFSPRICGEKSAQQNPPEKPTKSSKFYTRKALTIFCRGARPTITQDI